jgi:hypothetical protein
MLQMSHQGGDRVRKPQRDKPLRMHFHNASFNFPISQFIVGGARSYAQFSTHIVLSLSHREPLESTVSPL